eukprot:scaffold86122_cov48-Attheya_sp.AAC.1
MSPQYNCTPHHSTVLATALIGHVCIGVVRRLYWSADQIRYDTVVASSEFVSSASSFTKAIFLASEKHE